VCEVGGEVWGGVGGGGGGGGRRGRKEAVVEVGEGGVDVFDGGGVVYGFLVGVSEVWVEEDGARAVEGDEGDA